MSFASDTFTGSSALQELSLYSANWSKQSGFTDVFEIGFSAQTFAYARNNETVYQNSGSPATADYTVSADITWLSGGSGSENPTMGVTGRNAAGSADFYFTRQSKTTLTLNKSVAGTQTLLASTANAMTQNVSQNVALVMAGTAISINVGASTGVLSATDSAISAAGKAGIIGSLMREIGVADVGSIDNFLAVDAGGGSPALTGVAGAGAVGTMVPVISPPLTGVSATGAVGTFAPKTSPPLTGVAGAGAVGTLVPNTTIGLTGVAAAGTVGTLSVPSAPALTGVAAAGAVGTLAPAVTVALTGVAAAGAVGSLGPATSPPVTGVAAVGGVGTLAPATTVPLIGVQAAGQVGSVTVSSPDVVVALTGVSAAGQVGNLGPVGGDVFVNPLVFGATRKEHDKWKRKRQHEPLAPLPELETFTVEPPALEVVAPAPAPTPAPVVSKPALTESPDDIMVYEAVFSLLAKGFFDA